MTQQTMRGRREVRNRLGTSVAALAVLVAQAGCQADSDPDPPATASPLASATGSTSPAESPRASSAGPTEPVLPAAARKRTGSGAEAFVRYWIDAVNHAQATGDTSLVRSLSQRRCTVCTGAAESIEAAHRRYPSVTGGQVTMGRLRALPVDFGAEWAGYALARAAGQTRVDSHGRTRRVAGHRFKVFAYVGWSHGRWMMRWLRTP